MSWDQLEDEDRPAACREVLEEDRPCLEDHHLEALEEDRPCQEDHHLEVLEGDLPCQEVLEEGHLGVDPWDLREDEDLAFSSRRETLAREGHLAELDPAIQANRDHRVVPVLEVAFLVAHLAHQAEAHVDLQLLLAVVVVAVEPLLVVVVQEVVALVVEVAVVVAAVVVAQRALVVAVAVVPAALVVAVVAPLALAAVAVVPWALVVAVEAQEASAAVVVAAVVVVELVVFVRPPLLPHQLVRRT